MSKTPEGKLKEKAAKLLAKYGGEYRSFGVIQKGYTNQKTGTFDWLVAYQGSLIWIEWKVAPNTPSPEQILFGQWIKKNGGKAYICYSLAEFLSILKENTPLK